MNAAVDQIESDLPRKIHGVERSWLEHSLNEWGGWIESNSDYEGYPRSDNVSAFLDGAGGGTGGHRILCLDMPHRIYSMHARVLLLPEHEQVVIWVEYVPKAKENGRVWERLEKCERLGLALETYRKRLWRAKLRILGISMDRD